MSEEGNQHDYYCPECGSDERIAVQALIWVALSDIGTDADDRRLPNHDHYWDEEHDAACLSCGCQGKVRKLAE